MAKTTDACANGNNGAETERADLHKFAAFRLTALPADRSSPSSKAQFRVKTGGPLSRNFTSSTFRILPL